MNWSLLINSLVVSGITTLCSVALGALVALSLVTADRRWRSLLWSAALATLALPPFLVVNCWLDLFGASGLLQPWLRVPLFSPAGAVVILTTLLWPFSALFIVGAWDRVEPEHIESDTRLRSTDLLRWVLWPAARGAAGLAAVVTFVIAFNQFTVPVILQVPVFPEELWLALTTRLNNTGAWAAAAPMIVGPCLALLSLRRKTIAWPRWSDRSGPARSSAIRRQLGRGWNRLASVVTGLTLAVGLALPLFQLVGRARTWTELPGLWDSSRGAIMNSALLAILTASAVLVIGTWLRRWRGGALLWLLFFVPGILLSQTVAWCLGWTLLYGTTAMVVLTFALHYLAIGWQGAAEADRAADPDLIDLGRLEGARGWKLFRHYAWPQMARPLIVGWYATYLLALWEVETLVLILPPGGDTLPLRIFQLLHYGHNAQVNAMCIVLLALALAPLLMWRAGVFIAELRKIAAQLSLAMLAVVLAGCAPASDRQRPVDSQIFVRAEIIGGRGSALGQFNKPRSVAVDGEDNLYVVDMTGRVQKFSPAGDFLLSWQLPQTDLGKPKGMATDTNGNIVVVEPHYQRVNHFAPDGTLISQWGRRGTNQGELVLPRAVAISPRGDAYLSEYTTVDRIQAFRAGSRAPFLVFGQPGSANGDFNRAEGLGFGPDGRLYVADSCNHRIQIFSADGTWQKTFGRAGHGPGEFSYPYDVRVDREGRQYVCEFGHSRIQVFDAANGPLEIIGGPGLEPGRFNNPWSIALDSRGNLYVADSGNHRVQKLVRR